MATQESEDVYISADGYDPQDQVEEPYEVYEDEPQQTDYPSYSEQPNFNLTSDYIEGEDDRRATARALEEAAIAQAKETERANKEFEKQAVKFAQNKAKTIAKETDEEACKRLSDKYNLYLKHFKHFCSKAKLTGKESRKELQKLVDEASLNLDTSGMVEAAQQNWFFLSHGLQFACKALGLNVEGEKKLSKELMDSMGMFEQEIKEMMILWPWLFRRPLLFRMGGKLLQVIWRVHMTNSNSVGSLQGSVPGPHSSEPAYSSGKARVELPQRFQGLFSRV